MRTFPALVPNGFLLCFLATDIVVCVEERERSRRRDEDRQTQGVKTFGFESRRQKSGGGASRLTDLIFSEQRKVFQAMPTSTGGGFGRFARKKQQEDNATTVSVASGGEGSIGGSNGVAGARESIEAAKKGLAVATKWTRAAADAVEVAQSQLVVAQSQLRTAQDAKKEAESFLESVEKRYEVIDVDDLEDEKPTKSDSLSPRQDNNSENQSAAQTQSTTANDTSTSQTAQQTRDNPTEDSNLPVAQVQTTAPTSSTKAQSQTDMQRQQGNDSQNQTASTPTGDSTISSDAERARADVSNLANRWREREERARVPSQSSIPPREMRDEFGRAPPPWARK